MKYLFTRPEQCGPKRCRAPQNLRRVIAANRPPIPPPMTATRILPNTDFVRIAMHFGKRLPLQVRARNRRKRAYGRGPAWSGRQLGAGTNDSRSRPTPLR